MRFRKFSVCPLKSLVFHWIFLMTECPLKYGAAFIVWSYRPLFLSHVASVDLIVCIFFLKDDYLILTPASCLFLNSFCHLDFHHQMWGPALHFVLNRSHMRQNGTSISLFRNAKFFLMIPSLMLALPTIFVIFAACFRSDEIMIPWSFSKVAFYNVFP